MAGSDKAKPLPSCGAGAQLCAQVLFYLVFLSSPFLPATAALQLQGLGIIPSILREPEERR